MGQRPQFKDDKDLDALPLQAADLLAWWTRRNVKDFLEGNPNIARPWKPTRRMDILTIDAGDEMIKTFFARVLDAGTPEITFGYGYRKFIQKLHWKYAVDITSRVSPLAVSWPET
jgi:hypothetical protein